MERGFNAARSRFGQGPFGRREHATTSRPIAIGITKSTQFERGLSIAKRRSSSYELGGDFSWEVDLWGKLKSRRLAAEADVGVIEHDLDALKLSLAIQVAQVWIGLIETREALLLQNALMRVSTQKERYFASAYESGLGDVVMWNQAKKSLENLRRQELRLRQSEISHEQSLAHLCGVAPGRKLSHQRELPEVLKRIPAGLPVDLLKRRPDILAAKQKLVASQQRLRGAEADFLPALKLTASSGISTDALKDLLDIDQLVWNIAAGISRPLLDGGRLKHQQQIAWWQKQGELHDYARTVLGALKEVELALSRESNIKEVMASQEESLSLGRRIHDDEKKRYAAGLSDLSRVFDAHERQILDESERLSLHAEQLKNRLDLHLALGGSFVLNPKTQNH